MFKKRALLVGFGLQVVLTCGALACEGQTGAVVFEDNFADDSGGWDLTPGDVDVKPPELVFSIHKDYSNVSAQNLTFNPIGGDYCAEVVLPPALPNGNNTAVGIEFWATGWRNYYSLQVFSNRDIALYRKTPEEWIQVFLVRNSPAVKTGSDAANIKVSADASVTNPAQTVPLAKPETDALNAIRVIAKAGRIVSYVNGTKIKEIRAQIPSGMLRFGLYAQRENAVPDETIVHFKSFKVTEGP